MVLLRLYKGFLLARRVVFEPTAHKHQTITFLRTGTLPSISCYLTVPGSAVMGFCIVMVFEAGGKEEIAKLKNEEPGHGKHLYLFTVERE